MQFDSNITAAFIGATTTLIVGIVPGVFALRAQQRNLDQVESDLNVRLTASRRKQVQLNQIEAYRYVWSVTAAIRSALNDSDRLRQQLERLIGWYNGDGFGIFLSPAAHDKLNELMYACGTIVRHGRTPDAERVTNKLIVDIRQQMRGDLGLFDVTPSPSGRPHADTVPSYTMSTEFAL